MVSHNDKIEYCKALVKTKGNCRYAESISGVSINCKECFLKPTTTSWCPTERTLGWAKKFLESSEQDKDNQI